MRKLLLTLLSMASAFAYDAFISAQTLHDESANKNLVIIDVANEKDFNRGHIPNAHRIEMGQLRKQVGKHQLMRSADELEKLFRSLGVNTNSDVIIYGQNKKKESLKSAYTALSLINMGHNSVSILDGGFVEWTYEDFLQEKKTVPVVEGNFKAAPRNDIMVDRSYVEKNIGKLPMLEARPAAFYYGTVQSGGVARRGHIKGAMSSFWKDKFTEDDMLQTPGILDEIFIKGYGLSSQKEVILYCTGGLEASMNWYILHQHMNFTKAKMYDASMREWGNLDKTPMTRYAWETFAK